MKEDLMVILLNCCRSFAKQSSYLSYPSNQAYYHANVDFHNLYTSKPSPGLSVSERFSPGTRTVVFFLSVYVSGVLIQKGQSASLPSKLVLT
jgi:hypothetical protein